MAYARWFKQHGEKHARIMRKLRHLSKEEIIAYFRFDNMRIKEPDFCPLYAKNKKCHDIEPLNCYLCACPYFRFDDKGFDTIDGKVRKSYCAVNAKEGRDIVSGDVIHLDCSGCTIPHREAFVSKRFDRDWFVMMRDVTEE
jgi:hypothetical protein